MKLRTKLLIAFTASIAAAVGIMAWSVNRYVRREFEGVEQQRTEMLVTQFRREYAHRGDEVVYAVQGIAEAEGTLRMAMELSRPQRDPSLYARDARGLAAARQLDFLELIGDDGVLISSAQWPERIGFRNEWVTQDTGWNDQGAFLSRMELPQQVDLGLLAVRVVNVGAKKLYIVGGKRLDNDFLGALVVPEGTRVLLYRNLEKAFVPAALSDTAGPADQADQFAPVIESMQKEPRTGEYTIRWSADPASIEKFRTLPLTGRRNELLGALLIGNTQAAAVTTFNYVRSLAMMIGGAGILTGLLLTWWIPGRITRPLERMEAAAHEVASGKWDARVETHSGGEAGRLVRAFNHMTRQITEKRETLMQTERVAAWREFARHIAIELKVPLFALQVEAENLMRSRQQTPEQFDEVFFDAMKSLCAELETIKCIVAQFSDLAKMPQPQLQPVNVNEIIRAVVKAFEPHFHERGRPPITPELLLDENGSRIPADAGLLYKGFENLITNSLSAMPAGGTLTIRTVQSDGLMRINVSDTGSGVMPGGQERLPGSRYSTKLRGTGPGLAVLQAVVSDHGGRISVESGPGAGTTFRIEFPTTAAPAAASFHKDKDIDALGSKQRLASTAPESKNAVAQAAETS